MSTSTVSVTATPRRRISSLTAVQQSIHILDTATTTATEKINVAAAAKSNDLSRQSVGEVSSKETTSTSATTETTTKKVRKQVKPPRWKRLVSVVFKNLLVVLVVSVLFKFISNLDSNEELGFSVMEGRVKAVETSIKTVSRMVEANLEAVERKIDAEIGNLRGEIGRRVEDKAVGIDSKLKELELKTELLESELGELREVSKGFVSKEDVITMYNKLRNGDVEVNVASLDEIRGLAREIVKKEIEKHGADGVGRVDYAVASGGARVVKHSEALVVGNGVWFRGTREVVHENAVRMLSPSFGEPGMCFALKDSSGFVQIRLRSSIVPEAVTLEHVAKSVAYDQSSAPKNCRVFGWLQSQQDENEKVLLTEFTYDLEKSNAQTYNLIDLASTTVVDTVRFEFSTNHGSPTHTCIYRLRVHGHVSEPVPLIA